MPNLKQTLDRAIADYRKARHIERFKRLAKSGDPTLLNLYNSWTDQRLKP